MAFNDALHEVLETRRYDRLMGRTRNLREMIADFIDRHVTALLERLNIAFPQGDGDADLIPLLFAVIGGVLLAVGVIVFVRTLIRGRKPKIHTLLDLFGELAGKDLTVADLLAMSDNASDRRLSVRYRYIAALLALDEGNVIRITPSATNALILRELKKHHPALTQPFTVMADTFHLSWFGNKDINDGDFSFFCAAGDKLTGIERG
ncbi:MAG: hypothetical protein FWE90_00930 [Defluviitaleaceae bacterium]|nr:hypothetical protein [Defluviitaleaceae bacterium]